MKSKCICGARFPAFLTAFIIIFLFARFIVDRFGVLGYVHSTAFENPPKQPIPLIHCPVSTPPWHHIEGDFSHRAWSVASLFIFKPKNKIGLKASAQRTHCIRIHLSIDWFAQEEKTTQHTNDEWKIHPTRPNLNCWMQWIGDGKVRQGRTMQNNNKIGKSASTAGSRDRGACGSSSVDRCPNAKLLWFEFLKSQWDHYTTTFE